MPISRARKAELIESYQERIDNSQAMVVAQYRGLSVSQMEHLRNELRAKDASFVIAKKTLMSLALSKSDNPVPEEAMVGPVGFTFLGEDLALGAQVLKDFTKDISKDPNATFEVLGGILGDSILDAKGAAALADLPSRDVQLAMLVGAIAGPMTALVNLVSAPHRDLVNLLQARIDEQGGDEVADEVEVAEAA